jgi:hypothetical protein
MISACITAGAAADAGEALLFGLPEADFFRLIQKGLERQPIIALASIAAMTVPMVALVCAALRLAARRRQDVSQGPQADGLVAHRSAWIEIPDQRGSSFAVGELIRIGGSDDCDLAIADASVGSTCALIQRTTECEFILFDVSAGAARLAVNGAPFDRCRLSDGDRIEIGSACVVFRTSNDSSAASGSLCA